MLASSFIELTPYFTKTFSKMHQLWNGRPYSSVWDRFWWRLAEIFRILQIQFICCSFHVDLLVITLSSLSNCTVKITRAWFFWKSCVEILKLKVASLGLHTRSQSHLTLVSCVVDDVLRQTWPGVDETLFQRLQESCKHTPAWFYIVDRFHISTVRRSQIWQDELRCLLLQELDSLTCPVCRRTAHCLAGIQSCRLQCDAWLAVSVASARLHGNTTTVIFKFKNAWRNTKKNEIK